MQSSRLIFVIHFLYRFSQVATLFDDQPDLLEEFTRFLPDNSASPASTQNFLHGRVLAPRVGERNSSGPTSRQLHMDKVISRVVNISLA